MNQLAIPGTEKISDRELAARRAALPLKPKVAQERCDLGLFSDQSKQVDLVDLSKRKVS